MNIQKKKQTRGRVNEKIRVLELKQGQDDNELDFNFSINWFIADRKLVRL